MFSDRLEVHSPGVLYGHLGVEDLGFAQPETRNQSLVAAMEYMGYTENRCSGIPRIRRLMTDAGLSDPVFESQRGQFTARLYNNVHHDSAAELSVTASTHGNVAASDLLAFCDVPRSRSEIAQHLGLRSQSYAMRRYITPLVELGQLQLSSPDKPRSSLQRYTAVARTTVQPRLPQESER